MIKRPLFSMKKTFLLLVFILLFTGADLIIKEYMENNLSPGQEVTVIPGFWSYYYAQNDDIGFSLLNFLDQMLTKNQKKNLLVGLQLAATLLAIYLYYSFDKWKFSIPMALVISGGLGNVLDRIIRGYVVDYVKWSYKTFVWPIFNLADTYSVIGVGILFIMFFIYKEETEKA